MLTGFVVFRLSVRSLEDELYAVRTVFDGIALILRALLVTYQCDGARVLSLFCLIFCLPKVLFLLLLLRRRLHSFSSITFSLHIRYPSSLPPSL